MEGAHSGLMYPWEKPMKFTLLAAIAFASVITYSDAQAQTKAEQCAAYARDAASHASTSTGAARGAARGAIIGGAAGGEAGSGAAAGAVVGGARRRAQKNRSYQSYYDQCMKS
jgi:hypothetical protein